MAAVGYDSHILRIILQGKDNVTYTGFAEVLHDPDDPGSSLSRKINPSLVSASSTDAGRRVGGRGSLHRHPSVTVGIVSNTTVMTSEVDGLGLGNRSNDPTGQGYYVVAVFLVYGMSIVLLIASHIRRKHSKLAVDREIVKYLQEFQVVRETSRRDSYRNLKRSIVAKLSRQKHFARLAVCNAALPMAVIALPHGDVDGGSEEKEEDLEGVDKELDSDVDRISEINAVDLPVNMPTGLPPTGGDNSSLNNGEIDLETGIYCDLDRYPWLCHSDV